MQGYYIIISVWTRLFVTYPGQVQTCAACNSQEQFIQDCIQKRNNFGNTKEFNKCKSAPSVLHAPYNLNRGNEVPNASSFSDFPVLTTGFRKISSTNVGKGDKNIEARSKDRRLEPQVAKFTMEN